MVRFDWKPSETVLALTPEQVEEVRKRLNVNVEVEAGQPPAAAPIESFDDMVRPEQRARFY